MKNKIKRFFNNRIYRVIPFIVLLVVIMSIFCSPAVAYAYENTYIGDNDYDDSKVLDDLEGASINGSTFDILDYSFDSTKSTQVLTFTEYCYSYYANEQGNYSLYVYVWNPQGISFDTDSASNQITIRFGDDEDGNYSKYQLLFCNCSSGDYRGLFYKFKVCLTADDKEEIFSTLNSLKRVYSISEIELRTSGDTGATSYYVSTEYTYTGFAAGYGSGTDESTLECSQQQCDTLSLSDDSIGFAFYRPSGNCSTDEYTQDSLHSVYFAVPNSIVNTYGYLCGLHATWLNALLYPMLVTGNERLYNNITNSTNGYANGSLLDYRGVDISSLCEDDYYFRTAVANLEFYSSFYYKSRFSYGLWDNSAIYDSQTEIITASGSRFRNELTTTNLSKLYSVFYSGNDTDSADSYSVSSSVLKSDLLRATEASYEDNYSLINGTYASYLFDSVDSEWTDFKVDMREGYDGYENSSLSLTNVNISGGSYNFLGITINNLSKNYTTTIYDGIPAVYALSDSDFSDSYSDGTNAQNLYVSNQDYSDLKEFYEKWSTKTTYTSADGTESETDGYTIYLCRYEITEYTSAEATVMRKTTDLTGDAWLVLDTNAYFFQETVDLGFDIIDVTFTNGETDTVLGVVMSPVDVIHSSTAPVHTTSDKSIDWKAIVAAILLLLLIIVLCVLFAPVIPYIVKAVLWIITAPFKLIAGVYKGIKSSVNKNKRE